MGSRQSPEFQFQRFQLSQASKLVSRTLHHCHNAETIPAGTKMDMEHVIERLDSEIAITASSVFGIGIAEAVRQPRGEQPTDHIVGIRDSTSQDDAHVFGGTS